MPKLTESIPHTEFVTVWEWEDGDWPAPTFKVYETFGFDDDFRPWYEDADGMQTIHMEEAQILVQGFIKWDDCGHWMFAEGYNHICGHEALLEWQRMFTYIYEKSRLLWGKKHILYREPEGEEETE